MFEELISVCCKLKITPNQYLLYCLVEEQNIARAYEYINKIGYFEEKDIRVLLDKEFILPNLNQKKVSTPNGDFIITEFEIDCFIATSKVEDILGKLSILDKDAMFDDLWNLYPNHINASGQKWPTKACSQEEMKKEYFRAIRNKPDTHDIAMGYVTEMIEDTGGFAIMKFANFISSRAWELKYEKKNSGKGNDFTLNV